MFDKHAFHTAIQLWFLFTQALPIFLRKVINEVTAIILSVSVVLLFGRASSFFIVWDYWRPVKSLGVFNLGSEVERM